MRRRSPAGQEHQSQDSNHIANLHATTDDMDIVRCPRFLSPSLLAKHFKQRGFNDLCHLLGLFSVYLFNSDIHTSHKSKQLHESLEFLIALHYTQLILKFLSAICRIILSWP